MVPNAANPGVLPPIPGLLHAGHVQPPLPGAAHGLVVPRVHQPDPVLGNAEEWWAYAIGVHMEGVQERSKLAKWETALEKARQNVIYVKAFKVRVDLIF